MELYIQFVLLAIISYIFYIDARAMERRDGCAYRLFVFLKPRFWAYLSFVFFIFITPLYLSLRFFFYRNLRAEGEEVNRENHRKKDLEPMDGPLIIIVWFSIVAVLQIFLSFVVALKIIQDELVFMVLSGMIVTLALALMIFLVALYRKVNFFECVRIRMTERPLKNVVFVPALTGVSYAALMYFIHSQRQNNPLTPFAESVSNSKSTLGLVLLVILAVFYAPVLEEIMFRGFFYTQLKRHRGKVFSLVFITFLFGLYHVAQYWGDWLAIAGVFVLGLIITYMREKHGSILPSMTMHFAYNTSFIALPLVISLFTNYSYFKYSVLYRSSSADEKIAYLEKNISDYMDKPDILNELAWYYAEEKRELERALDLINKALVAKPENTQFMDTKAEILYQLCRYQEAIDIEEKILRKSRAEFFKKQLKKFKKAWKESQKDKGDELLESKKYREALEVYNKLIESHPSDACLYHYRAEAFEGLGKDDYVLKDLGTSIRMKPYARHYSKRGAFWRRKKEYERALNDFNRAIEIKPDDPYYYSERALTYGYLEQYEEGIKDLTRAIQKCDEEDMLYSYYECRGNFYRYTGNPQEALQDYANALELRAEDAGLYYKRGRLLEETGENEHALRDFLKVIEIDPEYLAAYGYAGDVYFERKEYSEALSYYQKIIMMDERFTMAYIMSGFCYSRLNEFEKAKQMLQKAADLAPESPFPLTCLGLLHYKFDDRDSFRAYIESSIQKGKTQYNLQAMSIIERDRKNFALAIDYITESSNVLSGEEKLCEEFYLLRASIYYMQGDLKKADEDIRQYIRVMNPSKEGVVKEKTLQKVEGFQDFLEERREVQSGSGA